MLPQHGWTPAHWAAFKGKVDVLRYLHKRGAAVAARTAVRELQCVSEEICVAHILRLTVRSSEARACTWPSRLAATPWWRTAWRSVAWTWMRETMR